MCVYSSVKYLKQESLKICKNNHAEIVFLSNLSVSTWLGDIPATSTTCALPWSTEIKAAVCSKLHLIIALEEVGRGFAHPTLQHPGYHDNSSISSDSVDCLDSQWGGKDARGGFPQQESTGRSMQHPSKDEKERINTFIKLIIHGISKLLWSWRDQSPCKKASNVFSFHPMFQAS